ncbi:GntR family transcriptional regulator [Micromonospora craterilacus]|uniref:GntR family transcriptional regulator n=1 Tax=Micromonospora craterilacus TaxID=1655439 RepID=A0A2W2DUT4_9ACTN|nr:winged helix-turn-helix domain-containing protein [Micromonospora craterilacus]PZG07929.1 GntR family transcriptional regulator [Micromonospora craterilacus]
MIDPASGVPAWRQLADLLRARIAAGEWPPGARLPSETDLVQQYELGRTTVRRAISSLRSAGVVEVIHGWGMRVPAPREMERVVAESGSIITIRMPTPMERATWEMPDGVGMIVVTGPDGVPYAYPGDRTEVVAP